MRTKVVDPSKKEIIYGEKEQKNYLSIEFKWSVGSMYKEKILKNQRKDLEKLKK